MIYFSISNPKTATFALPNWRRLLIRRGRGGARGGTVVEEPGEAGKGFIRRGRGRARGRMAVEERGKGVKVLLYRQLIPNTVSHGPRLARRLAREYTLGHVILGEGDESCTY